MKKKATIVVDLGFGDAGKGTTVDYLARQGGISAMVRFNGGAQARHFVVTPDGRTHGFAQFGSGTFVPGVETFLSRFVLVDPMELVKEAELLAGLGCRNALSRIAIDERAMVVTPMHRALNRLREIARGAGRHGSCGMGIGEAMKMSIEYPEAVIRIDDLRDLRHLTSRLRLQQEAMAALSKRLMPYTEQVKALDGSGYGAAVLHHPNSVIETAEIMHSIAQEVRIVPSGHLKELAQRGSLIFEGAQGVLLDEWRGFHPHTTWSTTTPHNAQTLLQEIGYEGEVQKLGVMRAYHTRHGAGPFPTETSGLPASYFVDRCNGEHEWQGKFRVGWLDMVLLRYALEVSGGVDGLVVTHLDQYDALPHGIAMHICNGYSPQGNTDIVVHRLPVNPSLTYLAFQERLTTFLNRATPRYEPAPFSSADLIQRLADAFGTPVVIGSYGPSAADKRRF
ncbi:MAG: adenylosuccinate synthetase [Candidatus Pacebacteria bacterium]|nr:adenylosuccinate synthetase [Candidatus Paceibacterota bacterium]